MSRKKPPNKIWFPTLLQSANNIDTNSWFDMNCINNTTNNTTNLVKLKNDKDIKYIKTIKIPIYPTKKQNDILLVWYSAVNDAYNMTNEYIKQNINNINIEHLNIKNFRNIVKDKLIEIQKNTINDTLYKGKISMHTLDYSVSHCISMYKSANTNFKRYNITQYDIKNLSMAKNRYNLVIEKHNFSKKTNAIFKNILGYMNSENSLRNNKFQHNCILQYHKNTNRFFILAPFDKINTISKTDKRYKKCGVDLGIRTFATIYSPDKVIEIGNNTNKYIDKYHKKMDNIQSQKDKGLLKEKLYKKLLEKYGDKMRNKIKDLHSKTAVFLTKNFKEINLGKFSIKVMVNNTTSKLKEIVKRRGHTLSFFRFNTFISIMAKKYDCQVNLVDEYKTSKTCHSCKNEKNDLGQNKTYNCTNCKITLGRDVNAAINMFNGGFPRPPRPTSQSLL